MEKKTKAQTFIGFAIRAKKYRIGMNAVQTLKSINLLIVCCSASENTLKDAKKVASKYHCPILITNETKLEEMTYKVVASENETFFFAYCIDNKNTQCLKRLGNAYQKLKNYPSAVHYYSEFLNYSNDLAENETIKAKMSKINGLESEESAEGLIDKIMKFFNK